MDKIIETMVKKHIEAELEEFRRWQAQTKLDQTHPEVLAAFRDIINRVSQYDYQIETIKTMIMVELL